MACDDIDALAVAERMVRDLPRGKEITTTHLIPLLEIVFKEYDARADELAHCLERIANLESVLREFRDPSECWFDPHGGCQGHGFDLDPGEKCPQVRMRELLNDVD